MSALHTVPRPALSAREISLYDEAWQEALRHKWIESQKRGHDVGDPAIQEWYRRHWHGYCRYARIEHLEGCRRYREFGDDFGHLVSLMVRRDLLTDRILDRFFAGYENLDIINWAMDWGLPVDEVIEVLVQLDMNRARLDP
jgi:hypothetical protein